MNNKKLFKGALVLFASILMAVSCSSNTNPEDDKKEEAKVTEVGVAEVLKAMKDLGSYDSDGADTETGPVWDIGAKYTDAQKLDEKQAVTEAASSTSASLAKTTTDITALITEKFGAKGMNVTVTPGGTAEGTRLANKAAREFKINISGVKKGFKLKSDVKSDYKTGGKGIEFSITPNTDWKA